MRLNEEYPVGVGLAAANGVMARRVGIAAGAGWIVLGLLPGAASVLYAIPAGILGAACFYSATFTIRSGIAMLSQRLVDTRRTLIIGSAVAASVLVVASLESGSVSLWGEALATPITIGGLVAAPTIVLSACGGETVSPASTTIGTAGGARTLTVGVASAGCPWQATTDSPSWITFPDGSSGVGGGPLTYQVAANDSGGTRTGTVTVGAASHVVTQAGPTVFSGTVVREDGSTVSGAVVVSEYGGSAETGADGGFAIIGVQSKGILGRAGGLAVPALVIPSP